MKPLLLLSVLLFPALGPSAEDSFTTFFDDMIREQEREVQELKDLRSEALSKNQSEKKNFRERVDSLRETMRADFQKFSQLLRGKDRAHRMSTMEIKEDPGSYDLKLTSPGISPKDMRVKIEDNDLIVSGKSEIKSRDGKGTKVEELEIFQKVHLNHTPDPASLKVDWKDGVMNVHVDKAEMI